MKKLEEVRDKMIGYPPEAKVPLSQEEIDTLKMNAAKAQIADLVDGYVFGRYFGLEARAGSKLTRGAVVAAARGIPGLRVGDYFNVRCPEFFENRPFSIEDLEMMGKRMTSSYETFLFTPELAASVASCR